MAITWPATLPTAPLARGYQEILPDNTLRSDMDKGPAKVRQRGQRPRMFDVEMTLDVTQISALDTFLTTTTAEGTLRFEWTHPRTDATIECRFVPSSGGMIVFDNPRGAYMDATFRLEVMP